MASEQQAIQQVNPPRIRKSRKAPSVKAAVITRRVNGESKLEIAKDLGITRNTVTTILEESNVEQYLNEHRANAIELIPLAHNAVKTKLIKGDGNLGRQILVDMAVIGPEAQSTKPVTSQMAAIFNQCQVLIQQSPAEDTSNQVLIKQEGGEDK